MRRALVGCAGLFLMLAGAAGAVFGIFSLWASPTWNRFDLGPIHAPSAVVGLVLVAGGVVAICGGYALMGRADRFAKPS